jgi:hypothetical protein
MVVFNPDMPKESEVDGKCALHRPIYDELGF